MFSVPAAASTVHQTHRPGNAPAQPGIAGKTEDDACSRAPGTDPPETGGLTHAPFS